MGAFYTTAKLPIDDCEKFCKWCLTDFRRDGKTIMMAPGTGFYSDPQYGHDQVRLAYVLNVEDLKEALKLLAEALEEYNSLPKK
jgi:aspartate aminotransferase